MPAKPQRAVALGARVAALLQPVGEHQTCLPVLGVGVQCGLEVVFVRDPGTTRIGEQIRAILLTPVSPHMLFDRALVLDPQEPVTVEVLGPRPSDLSVDGRWVAGLEEGDTVMCGADVDVARFVRFGGHRFHQILKTKFGLSDR